MRTRRFGAYRTRQRLAVPVLRLFESARWLKPSRTQRDVRPTSPGEGAGMTRLLFVKQSQNWPRSSGQDVHGYHMMQALAARGHAVSLATIVPPPTGTRRAAARGVASCSRLGDLPGRSPSAAGNDASPVTTG